MFLAFLSAWCWAGSDGVFPYELSARELDNGLTVLVVPMESPGVVSYYTWMAVGSRDEVDPGRTGFAHFFEHLMFYGTETLGKAAREQELARMGAEENAWTWLDDTVYHATIAREELPRLVELEADRFQRLHLTADDVQRQAGAIYGEFRKSQASPGARLEQLLFSTMFTTHTYGHDTLGYEADIAAMPGAFDYANQFFDRMYRPENALVIVVGDAQPDEVFSLVEKHYADWKPGSEPRPIVAEEPEQTELRRASLTWPGATAARIQLGWRLPANHPDDNDIEALELVANLLGSDLGPLERTLVRERGLAYQVGVSRYDLVDPAALVVSASLKDPAHLEEVEKIVREEVERLRVEVDEALVERVRSHTRYRFLTSLDTPGEVASEVGWSWRRGGEGAIDAFYAAYDAVSVEDVQRVASTWLVDDHLTVVSLIPASEEE